jgi:uncharacterized protein (DUF58 family)
MTTFKPSRRAVLLFSAGIPPGLVLSIVAPDFSAASIVWAAVILATIAVDAGLALPVRAMRVRVTPPDRLYLGDAGAIAGDLLAPPGMLRSVRFDIAPELTGAAFDTPALTSLALAPDGEARFAIGLTPRRRGRITLERVWLRWRGPLGLAEATRILPIGCSIDVLPNVRGVQSAALQFFSNEAVFGQKVQRERGQGSEFAALRDYAPGLDSRFIDWKHSARHRRLLCREFEAERNHVVIMAFDTGHLMREPVEGLARLDHAINAGLLLAWISLRGGDLVGVYGFDARVRGYLRPVRSMAGFGRIQQAAANLDYTAEETNFTLGLAELNIRLRRRALVVLFTDFVDTITAELLIESLQRIGNKHVVIFVTLRDATVEAIAEAEPARFDDVARAVIAHDLLRDRRIVLERLERMGIHCLETSSAGLSVALLNRYLIIKQRGLI